MMQRTSPMCGNEDEHVDLQMIAVINTGRRVKILNLSVEATNLV